MERRGNTGTLQIRVCRAKGLINIHKILKQNPYVVLRISNLSERTKTDVGGGQNPQWDDVKRFRITYDTSTDLELLIMDETKNFPKMIGELTVDFSPVFYNQDEKTGDYFYDDWFTVRSQNQDYGEIYLEITYEPDEKRRKQKFRSSGAGSDYNSRPTRELPFIPGEEAPKQNSSPDQNSRVPPPLPRNPQPQQQQQQEQGNYVQSRPSLPQHQSESSCEQPSSQLSKSYHSQNTPNTHHNDQNHHADQFTYPLAPELAPKQQQQQQQHSQFEQSDGFDFDFDNHLNSIPDLPNTAHPSFNHSGSSHNSRRSFRTSQQSHHSFVPVPTQAPETEFRASLDPGSRNHNAGISFTNSYSSTSSRKTDTNQDFDALLRAVQSDHPRRETTPSPPTSRGSPLQRRRPEHIETANKTDLPPPPLPPHSSSTSQRNTPLSSPVKETVPYLLGSRSPERKPPASFYKSGPTSPVKLNLHAEVPYAAGSDLDHASPPSTRLSLHERFGDLNLGPSSNGLPEGNSTSYKAIRRQNEGRTSPSRFGRIDLEDGRRTKDDDEFQEGFNAPLPSQLFSNRALPNLGHDYSDSHWNGIKREESPTRRSPSRFRDI